MKNSKGFSFVALILVIAGMTLATTAAIYVVKKNPGGYTCHAIYFDSYIK